MIRDVIIKYKSLILYLLAGALTTLVSMGVYSLCYYLLRMPNVPSEIISWILAVATAFVANKVVAFESKSWKKEVWIPEAAKFVSGRLVTGIFEVVAMWLLVDILHGPGIVMKFIISVIIVILNYILSKWIVFKNKDTKKEDK